VGERLRRKHDADGDDADGDDADGDDADRDDADRVDAVADDADRDDADRDDADADHGFGSDSAEPAGSADSATSAGPAESADATGTDAADASEEADTVEAEASGEAEAGEEAGSVRRPVEGRERACGARLHAVILGAAAALALAVSAPAAHPAAGARLGTLEIPRLDVRTAFYEGTSARVLARGSGHYPTTSLPGRGGTIGLAGHRTTYGRPFARINLLRTGDRIVVRTGRRHTYRVYRMRIVPPWQVWPLRRTRFEQLVLTACHPPRSDRFRLVVFARRL
jgi:LPXTG-site transpeptidase (sortase) family protein